MAEKECEKKGENPQKKGDTSSDRPKKERPRNGWSDIIDELDFGNGPGENIYVYG